MKKLFTITALFLSITIYSQKYEVGAMEAMGFAYKMPGTIELTDSMMFIDLENKEGVTNTDFDIINERNGFIYVSDGVETYKIQFIDRGGRRKGYKYSKTMSFIHPNGQMVLYYINPLQ